ncbi:hypothetical protein LUZ60_013071 [Juncus effusus]|nr:hypothetical protein LUZ60_013071 [Juncus effusus]
MARSARRILLISLFVLNTLPLLGESKSLDPYKVLGVDKSANQRDIQKAFHKLSLKYHPDKNKAKGAQEKFAEINNAYEILSDEEKRKNYDLYGNETPNPGFDSSNFGNENRNGYTYFNTGSRTRSNNNFFRSNPSSGNTKTFSFSFGGDPNSQFGFGDIFSNFFGGGMNNGFGFDSQTGSKPKSKTENSNPNPIVEVTTQYFNKNINNQGMTWLLLFHTPNSRQYYALETLIEEISSSLNGAIKAGIINCLNEKSLCQKAGLTTGFKSAKLFIYSYTLSEKGSFVEYTGDLDSKSLKSFVQEHLPRFSKRVDLNNFVFPSMENQNLPQILLLSTKRDTPLMWRVITGLFRNRFLFYDAQVNDFSIPMLKRLGVKSLPALIGRTVDGSEHLIKSGISIPDLKSGTQELKSLLESFERKNKRVAASYKPKKQEKQESTGVSILTASNFNDLCGEKTALCIIGVFKSSKSKENLEKILTAISQKTMVRGQNSVTYALLDGNKQYKFLQLFDKSGYKTHDKFVIAYKPKRGKFALHKDEFTLEEVEKFVGSVLNGDVQFSSVSQKPVVS